MTTRFEYPLLAEQIATFERDGVIHLPGVLGEKGVERGREACAQVPAVETVEGSMADDYFMKLRCWEKNQTFKQICTASALPGIAAQLVRSEKMNVLYDQIQAATVNIDHFAQVLISHCRALNVPTWPAHAPRTFPSRFIFLGELPQREIRGVAFARLGFESRALEHVIQRAAT